MDINFNHSLPWSFLSLSCSMCMKHFQNGSSNLWSTWCTVLSLKLWMVSVDVNSIIKGEHFPGFLLKKKKILYIWTAELWRVEEMESFHLLIVAPNVFNGQVRTKPTPGLPHGWKVQTFEPSSAFPGIGLEVEQQCSNRCPYRMLVM